MTEQPMTEAQQRELQYLNDNYGAAEWAVDGGVLDVTLDDGSLVRLDRDGVAIR